VPKPPADAWIPLAVVGRPHGVRGELRVHPFAKDSELLLVLDEVLVRFPKGHERAGEEHEVSIDGARRGNDAILLKLHGVDERDGAEGVRGAELCVKRGDFPPADDGEFYACDLEGADALLEDGTKVGVVRTIASYPSVDVLVIEGARRLEIPLVEAYVVRVDVEGGRVLLRDIDGF
jgi:16S rRNA processing protein RimM